MNNKEGIMNIKTISGKEILENFFIDLDKLPEIDTQVADTLKELYQHNKFTHSNLSNALERLREEAFNDKD